MRINQSFSYLRSLTDLLGAGSIPASVACTIAIVKRLHKAICGRKFFLKNKPHRWIVLLNWKTKWNKKKTFHILFSLMRHAWISISRVKTSLSYNTIHIILFLINNYEVLITKLQVFVTKNSCDKQNNLLLWSKSCIKFLRELIWDFLYAESKKLCLT